MGLVGIAGVNVDIESFINHCGGDLQVITKKTDSPCLITAKGKRNDNN